MLLAKTKLNTIEVLISTALVNSYINHNEFVSVQECATRIEWDKRRNQKS